VIFLWGLPGDRPILMVRNALRRLGAHVYFLDQRSVLSTSVEISVGARVGGTVWAPDETLHLDAVTAVYPRPYETQRLPDVKAEGRDSRAWLHAMNFDDVLWSWIDLAPALVVNRTEAGAANGSKPYQAQLIRSYGFATPETLVTTDPAAALAFWRERGDVIYKSVSGVRSIVARLKPGDEERLADVAWCPTQLQTYVPGTDCRVHVVHEEVFASEVATTGDDYRYARMQGGETRLRACELPADVAERCRRMAAGMGLHFAGIDLRRTPDGEWYCFEVNPSPGFSYYEGQTGQPIAAAVARLLLGGAN
jgi:hypothetical protein